MKPRTRPLCHRSRRASRTSRAHFEPLEPRQLLSVAIASTLSLQQSGLHPDFITTDTAGNLYLAGSFRGTIDADPSPNSFPLTSTNNNEYDTYLLSLSPDGQLRWATSFHATTAGLVIQNNTLYLLADFLATCTLQTSSLPLTVTTPTNAALFASFNLSGNALSATLMPRTGTGQSAALLLDHTGGFWLIESFTGTIDADPGPATRTLTSDSFAPNFAVINLDSSGTLRSAQFLTTISTELNTFDTDYAGNLLLASSSIDSNYDILWKFTPTGPSFLWGEFFNPVGPFPDNQLDIHSTHADHSGNIYLDISVNGYGDLDPSEMSHVVIGNNTHFIVKLDPSGNYLWSGQLSPSATINQLLTDANDNLYLLGTFHDAIDLNLSNATTLLTGDGSPPALFLAKYDPQGVLLWETHTRNVLAGITQPSLSFTADGHLLLSLTITQDLSQPSTPASIFGSTQSADTLLITFAQTLLPSTLQLTTPQTTVNAADTPNLTAFVTTPGGIPTGSISFYDGILLLATVPLDSTGHASFTLPPLSRTTHIITAHYSGNNNYLPADDSPLDITALALLPTINLSAPRTHYFLGQRIYFSVTLTGNYPLSAFPTGTINFYDGNTLLGTATIYDSTLEWTIPLTTALGTHTFTARYLGDHFYLPAITASFSFDIASNNPPLAALTSSTQGLLIGWAADREDPDTHLVVQVWIDGIVRSSFQAGLLRTGIPPIGQGDHGFSFKLPALPAGIHAISLVTYDPATGNALRFATTSVKSDSLYFDESWYLAHYPDVAAAIAKGVIKSAWQHFTQTGAHKGRSPSAYFDESWYRARYPDIAAAVAAGRIASGFAHFVLTGAHEGRDPSPYFNELYYRREYPDVTAAVAAGTFGSAFAQFLTFGLAEGRSPTPWFDTASYLAADPQLCADLALGDNRAPFEHFLSVGLAQHRAPSPWFLEYQYLALNPDVASAVASGQIASGLLHFIQVGLFEGRTADMYFNPSWYITQYPDSLAFLQSGIVKSPYQHYLLYGRLVGHLPHP